MPPIPDKHYFLELGRHILLIARVGGDRIEAIRECGIDNRLAVEEALSSIKPDWQSEGMRAIVSLAPTPTGWLLGSPEESKKSRNEAALRAVVTTANHGLVGEMEITGCGSEDGAMIQPSGQGRWLLAFAPKDGFDTQTNFLAEWKIEPDRIESAGLSRIGAIVSALKDNDSGPVVLWDLAAEHSHLFLISQNGVEGVAPCAVTLDDVFTATQAALGLKFKGAAARLFFNDTYDFSQTSSKIAATLAPGLKNAMSILPQGGPPPHLTCLGLSGRQAWFIKATASALKIPAWNDDARRLAGVWNVGLDPELPENTPSLASLGLIHLIAAYARRVPAWHPTWKKTGSANSLPPMRQAATPAPFPATAPTAVPAEKPVAKPPPPAEPRPAPRAKPTLAPDSGISQSAPAQPAPAPPPPAPVPAAPKPEARPPAPAIVPSAPPLPTVPPGTSVPFPGLAVPKVLPPPGPKVTTPPTTGSPFPQHTTKADAAPPLRPRVPAEPAAPAAPVRPGLTAAEPAGATPQVKMKVPSPRTLPTARAGLYVGLSVLVAALILGTFAFLYFKANREKAEALQREQEAAVARAESERRAAEEIAKAQHEAEEAKRQTEQALADAVAAARKQAAEQERQRMIAQIEQERIDKLPGSLAIGTLPTAATVVVDQLPAQTSPATFRDLAPGTHTIHIELENYDPMDMKVQVKGGRTTDLGSLPLVSIAGSIEAKSNPPGLAFTVRLATDAPGTALFTGTTPATLPAVLPGDYLVTFQRDGWSDHEEKAHVTKRAKVSVVAGYDPVTVELTSKPAGATVKQNGHVLGTTPLTLSDVSPTQDVSYDLTLVGYDPVRLSHLVTSGSVVHLEAEMLSSSRIAKPIEIKQAPHAYETPDPNVTPEEKLRGAEVIISVVVLKNGSTQDIEVEKTTDRWIGERCAEAVKDWKFNPGIGFNGQPLNVKIRIPFTIGRTSP